MKLTLNFKEKHLCHVGKYLTQMSINDWGAVSNAIVAAIKTVGNTPETELPILIEHTKLIEIYKFLGYKSEREAAVRNEEMKYSLIPQLLALGEVASIEAAMAIEIPILPSTIQETAIYTIQALVKVDNENQVSIVANEQAYRTWALDQ